MGAVAGERREAVQPSEVPVTDDERDDYEGFDRGEIRQCASCGSWIDPPHHICDECVMFGPPPTPFDGDDVSPNPTALTAAPEEE